MILEIHPAATKESQRAWRWYHRRSPRAATGYEADVRAALEKIQAEPEAQRWLRYGARCRLLRTFPYMIVFYMKSDRIRVVSICHDRCRPGYWRKRR